MRILYSRTGYLPLVLPYLRLYYGKFNLPIIIIIVITAIAFIVIINKCRNIIIIKWNNDYDIYYDNVIYYIFIFLLL